MCFSTLLSFCPRLPAGWKRAKSSRPKFRSRLVTSARASPTASIAVVLLLGARPSGQASSTGPSSRTTRAARPSVLSARPVIAMIGTPKSASERQQPQDLRRLAALGENQRHVVGMDAAQVAVDRLGRVEAMAGRAGGGQRGHDLLAD